MSETVLTWNPAQPFRLRLGNPPITARIDLEPDLFGPEFSDGIVARALLMIARSPEIGFRAVTRHPDRAREMLARWADVAEPDLAPKLVRGPAAVRNAHASGRAQLFADYLDTMGEKPPPGCAWPTYDWLEGPRWLPAQLHNLAVAAEEGGE